MTKLRLHTPASLLRPLAASALAALALLLLFGSPARAEKTHLFLENFGSAAQPKFKRASSIAVEPASGDLLVISAEDRTVSRFKPNGEPDPFPALGTNVIDAGPGPGAKPCAEEPASCDRTPQGNFEFRDAAGAASEQLAVDDSGAATDGDIYVTQSTRQLVDVFAASGAYLGQLTAAGSKPLGALGPLGPVGGLLGPFGVTVDPSGDLFLADGFDGKVYKYEPSANPPLNSDFSAAFTFEKPIIALAAGAGAGAGSIYAGVLQNSARDSGEGVLQLDGTSLSLLARLGAPGNYESLAVDPLTGHLFAGDVHAGSMVVREFSAGGAPLSSFHAQEGSIASNAGATKIYLGQTRPGQHPIEVFGALVALPDATTGAYSVLSNTSIGVQGTVDPDGQEIEECRFEYGPTAAYGQSAPCAESPAAIGAGGEAVPVHADLSGLAGEATYHYRLLAKNPNGAGEGSDRTFLTPSKPSVESEWALGVGADAATIAASVNPDNSPTRYRFEWGTDTGYGSATGEIELGSDNQPHTVRFSLAGLAPATDYHYRVVAVNALGATPGPDRRLHTYAPAAAAGGCANEAFRGGASALLPDCRAYELASPLDKEGGDIVILPELMTERPAVLAQSSASGDRLAYGSVRAFGDAASAPYTSQYIAGRLPGGWASHGIIPAEERNLKPAVIADTEYRYFSADLCQGWLIPFTEPPLAAGALAGYFNLYRRDDQLCGGAPGYLALSNAKPVNLAPFNDVYSIEVQGVSEDGKVTAFVTDDNLEGTGAPTDPRVTQTQLYVKAAGAAGAPKFACVLPGGAKVSECSAGSGDASRLPKMRTGSETGALSADAKRLYWSDASEGEGKIYLRTNPLKGGGECAGPEAPCTVAVSEAGEALSGTSKSFFLAAAKDGAKALYGSGSLPGGNADLYQYTVAGAATQKVAGKVYGVVGQSADLGRVYLASGEEIKPGGVELENQRGEKPKAGKPNLYLYEAGTGAYRFIATLATGDVAPFPGHQNQSSATSMDPDKHNGRASGDGLAAAFMSEAPLTGFDNTDARSPEPCGAGHPKGICDNEAFLYDATARGGEGELVCASCNPGGARPAGRNVAGEGSPMQAAARLPVFETTLYQPRALSKDGKRLVFESVDPLTARDSNGKIDVYQWEAPGEGRCEEASASYSAQDGGCVDLLSSGHSPLDSGLVDADVEGENVFFTTVSNLIPSDFGSVDIYDARAGGGQPGPEVAPAGCEGEACQGAYEAPNDPTPASSSFEGAGNVSEAPLARCAKPKVRRKGRCVAKQHRKRAKRVHHRAANPNRRAAR